MTSPDPVPTPTTTTATTPTPAAATPLDYAGRTTPRPAGSRLTAVEWLVVAGLVLLLVVMLLPSLNATRVASPRVSCASNLRSVGQALHTYAYANGRVFPDTLAQVVLDGSAPDVRIFLCPACKDTPAAGATRVAEAADLTSGGHLSYVYAGRGLKTSVAASTVLMYEHPAHHDHGGGNVLFADGHVEWLTPAEIRHVADRHAAGHRPLVFRRAAAPLSPPATQPATRAAQSGTGGTAVPRASPL